MEGDGGDIIKDGEEVGLDGVSVRGLAEYLQQGGVRHEEEPGKYQPLLFQISWKRDVLKMYKMTFLPVNDF